MNQENHIYFSGVEPVARAVLRRLAGSSCLFPARNSRDNSASSASLSRLTQVVPEEAPGINSRGRIRAASQNRIIELDPFILWLFQQAGLDARAYQASALQRRLPACLRALRASTPESARALLEQRPALLSKAVNAMLIGVSEFFRDRLVFEYLDRQIIPQLASLRGGLRVYSAGCSQGQELYSMAILLQEHHLLENSCLLGVDCRAEAIQHARAGIFQDTELTGGKADRLRRCFERQGSHYKISPALQEKIHWRTGNILDKAGAGRWDMILCRNVAIYLNADEADTLWAGLSRLLEKGGVLVTGKAERPSRALPLERLTPCLYRRIDE